MVYTKVHVPFEQLCKEAEKINLKMRLKDEFAPLRKVPPASRRTSPPPRHTFLIAGSKSPSTAGGRQ